MIYNWISFIPPAFTRPPDSCFAPVASLLGLLICSPLAAQKLSRADRDLFEIHARPTLVAHCIACHGENKQESGLRLTSMDDLLQGGDSGPAIVPGKPGRESC